MSFYFLYYEGKSGTDVWSFADKALSAKWLSGLPVTWWNQQKGKDLQRERKVTKLAFTK